MSNLIEIYTNKSEYINSSKYGILLLKNPKRFLIDFSEYSTVHNSILFLSPYQKLEWVESKGNIQQVEFHSDYYCIEYHKKEVACNGILFNNIYVTPYVTLNDRDFGEIEYIIAKMKTEMLSDNQFSESIIKTYLQLILAICSKEKIKLLDENLINKGLDKSILGFPNVIEKYFLENKNVEFYANYFNMSVSSFSKKIKQQFLKTPSQLIQEKIILESKKLLHLTNKSIKEIAFELKFEDEFYFSRYFKKNVGVSPSFYRKNVGISMVAK